MDTDNILRFGATSALSIPQGTTAWIRALTDDSGRAPVQTGQSDYGHWILVRFEIIDGQFTGREAALMLALDTTNRAFREAVAIVTGVDLEMGPTISGASFRQGLTQHQFAAELGHQRRHGRETGYTNVFRLVKRF